MGQLSLFRRIFCAHKLFGTELCGEEDGRLCSDIYRTSGRTDWPDGRNSLPSAANFLFFTAFHQDVNSLPWTITKLQLDLYLQWFHQHFSQLYLLSNIERNMSLIALYREFTIRYSHFSGKREGVHTTQLAVTFMYWHLSLPSAIHCKGTGENPSLNLFAEYLQILFPIQFCILFNLSQPF